MNKAPPHSLYAKLTEDQRAQLYDWILTLGYPKTKERIALSEPEGFGITTHLSCLHRFYVRYVADLDNEHAAEAEQFNGPHPARLLPLAEQAAHAGAFRLTTAPLDSQSFGQLSQWVSAQQANQLKRDYIRIAEQNAAIAQKKAALAESRLELDREKFRFNAARHALIHFAELAVIARSNDKDNEDKIRAVADLLFQPQPGSAATAARPLSSTSSETLSNSPDLTGGGASPLSPAQSRLPFEGGAGSPSLPLVEPCSSRGHGTHDKGRDDFHVVPNQSSSLDRGGTTPPSPGQSRLPSVGNNPETREAPNSNSDLELRTSNLTNPSFASVKESEKSALSVVKMPSSCPPVAPKHSSEGGSRPSVQENPPCPSMIPVLAAPKLNEGGPSVVKTKPQLPTTNSQSPVSNEVSTSAPSASSTVNPSPLTPLPPVEISALREAPDSKCQMKNAQCSMLNESVVSHAIRRWRSYQPRRYQDPEPTNSWNDECPCGVKLPCEKHGDLWNFVRYMKTSDPQYAAHLKEAGIPFYTPTKDELTRSEPTDVPCTSWFYTRKPVPPPTVETQ